MSVLDDGALKWMPLKNVDWPNLCVNGDMELDSDWDVVGDPDVCEQSTEEHHAGTHAWKVSANAYGQGMEQVIDLSEYLSSVPIGMELAITWHRYCGADGVAMIVKDAEDEHEYLGAWAMSGHNIWASNQRICYTTRENQKIRVQFLSFVGPYTEDKTFFIDDVTIFAHYYHAGYGPAWLELAENMNQRCDFMEVDRPTLPLIQEDPEVDPVSPVGLCSSAETPKNVRDILSAIQTALNTLETNGAWCDSDGTSYSGFDLSALSLTRPNLKAICDNIRQSLDEHRYRAEVTIAFDSASSSGYENDTTITIPVSLSATCGETITVQYAVTGGTATGGGVDYTLASGQLSFAPGEITKNISVIIVEDESPESSETILITLSSPINAILGSITSHTYTILDDDDIEFNVVRTEYYKACSSDGTWDENWSQVDPGDLLGSTSSVYNPWYPASEFSGQRRKIVWSVEVVHKGSAVYTFSYGMASKLNNSYDAGSFRASLSIDGTVINQEVSSMGVVEHQTGTVNITVDHDFEISLEEDIDLCTYPYTLRDGGSCGYLFTWATPNYQWQWTGDNYFY